MRRLLNWLALPFVFLAVLWLARDDRADKERLHDPEFDDGQSSRRDSEG